MDRLLPVGDGHTELPEDDRRGLLPTYIATRGDLYAAEERNIASALRRRRRPRTIQLLDDKYLRDLHRALLGEVWEWAGRYRQTDTNLGVTWSQVPAAVLDLVRDGRAWVDRGTYEPDELGARFHHRLVQIHPFPNGNGRHARIAANYLMQSLGREPFSWGRGLDVSTDELRARYVHALREADAGDVSELLVFARE